MTDLEDLLRAVEEAEAVKYPMEVDLERIGMELAGPLNTKPGGITHVRWIDPEPWPWYIIYPTIFFSTFFGFTGFYWGLYLWKIRNG